jgi:hypothetical protein
MLKRIVFQECFLIWEGNGQNEKENKYKRSIKGIFVVANLVIAPVSFNEYSYLHN